MDIQLRHARVDFLPRRTLAIEGKGCGLRVAGKLTTDDKIGFALGALELDLDMALVLVVLNERLKILSAIKKLRYEKAFEHYFEAVVGQEQTGARQLERPRERS